MKIVLIALLMVVNLVASKLEVTASILPQKYFIEKITGDNVHVNVMVKKGFSPATYEPKTSQMRKLDNSKIYFSIGVPFEAVWLSRFESANKNMMVVDTSKGIEKLPMVAHSHHDEDNHAEEKHHEHDEHKHEKGHHDHDEHKHEKEQHHDHDEHKHEEKHHDHDEHKDEHHAEKNAHEGHHHEGGLDPHVWLDPVLVKVQAQNIYDALVKVDAQNATIYKSNLDKFLNELDALDKKLKATLKPVKDSAFMVFHPSWGYFAKRYDLEQIAVEKEGKEPKPKELVELIKEAKLHNIKVVFVAPQFSQKAAKTIAKNIKGEVVFLNPLSVDYANNLIKVSEVIQKSYQ